MEYFMSHIIYIIIAAVVIAFIAFAAVILAEKNQSNRDINEESCNFDCGSCRNNTQCHKEGKKHE